MADIRINALATTAASTASDDFVAVDGSANGTRKLNAFSPTFGGNATVTGTLTAGSTITSSVAGAGAGFRIERTGGSASLGTILNSGGEIIHDYNSFGYSFRVSTVEQFNLNATRALFAGNLTVSGTGIQQLGGNGALVKLGVPTNAPNTNLVGNLLQVKTGSGFAYITIGNGDAANSTAYVGGASGFTVFGRVTDAGVLTESARIPTTGNLLLGTTTDSSNGKLQLATHTTIAGGIGFGTDLSLFRIATNKLELRGTADAEFSFSFNRTAGSYQTKWENYIAAASTSLVWYNNGNLLTLDTSGNATFAGTVITPAATTAISSVRLPHGTAPTSPVNGDMWTTTAGLYVRINGVTVGPLS